MASVNFEYTATTETVSVNESHFGLNLLFHRDEVNGNQDIDTDYEIVADSVVTNVIRYPGGTITEQFFDPDNPNLSNPEMDFFEGEALTSGESESINLTPLDDVFEYAAETGSELVIVIPTYRYFDALEPGKISDANKKLIQDFVEYVINHTLVTSGAVKIAGFEIGNEWYDKKYEWSASQYGEFANEVVKAIQSSINEYVENGIDPKIFVQSSNVKPKDGVDLTRDIKDAFDDQGLADVDGVVTHFYTTNSGGHNPAIFGGGNPLGSGSGIQDRLENISEVWGEDTPILVSEWNVGANGPDNTSLPGLMRNAPFLRTFAEMIENGVDTATFWTAISPGNGAESLTTRGNPLELTPTGYLYRMLSQNVIGKDLHTQISSFKLEDSAGVHQGYSMVFESEDQTVIYFTSGIGEDLDITADLSGLIDANSHVYATRLSMEGDDHTSYYGKGEIFHETSGQLGLDLSLTNGVTTDAVANIILDDYELIQIVITNELSSTGVYLFGDDQNASTDTLIGTINDDTLIGNDGEDSLEGGSGSDSLDGGGQADTIISGAGNDTVQGGYGSDSIFLDAGNDLFVDTDQGGIYGQDWVDGGAGNDTFTGAGGNDTYYGKDGDDSITSGSGNDALFGGNGADFIDGGAGNDSLRGSWGTDHIVGGDGNDDIGGGRDNDSIDAGNGNDTIWGGTGNDSVSLGDGADVFHDTADTGSDGHDSVTGGSGNDTFNGVNGDDSYNGNQGHDVIYGGAGNNFLRGGNDHDTLSGGTGNDTIIGGTGNDILNGNAGIDRLAGGTGADVFVFDDPSDAPKGSSTVERITDFESGVDKIDLSNMDANINVNGEQSFQFIGTASHGSSGDATLRYSVFGNDVYIYGDVNGDDSGDFVIVLEDVGVGFELLNTDFIL
ncbi:MAG: calcium-binding protein [Pelagimonas sp.]|uniref:calcium-binding protein n=1 Tax=Pelagimonas sp. TaxID=2073170 RepID=UPI003D6A533D